MTAVWIGSPHPFDLHEAYVWFRHAWSHDGGQAWLAITGDSRYSVGLNGVFVARGPGRRWPQARGGGDNEGGALLRKRRNTITVLVYPPGYSHFAYVHRGAAGLLAWLDVDGARVWSTGSEWRARRDPAFSSDVKRVSIYAAGVEDRDLRRADGWHALDVEDDGWSPRRS